MNGRLTFLLRFLLAITVILILWVPVWLPIPSISQSYISFITHAAVYIAMPIVGLPDVYITTGGGFPGIIPFIALLLATPDIQWLRKLKLIITGSLLLLTFHLIIVVLQIVFPSHQTGLFDFYAISGRIALPLILWVTMSWDVLKPALMIEAVVEEKNDRRKKRYRCPICGEEKVGIIDHIRAVHGREGLENEQVKELLRDIRD